MFSKEKIWLLFLVICGWFALGGQFYLNITSNVAPIPELLVRFFSYFTILTNLIVAICSTVLLLKIPDEWYSFFKIRAAQTAVLVYILVVGLVYNLVLRTLWSPEGLQKIVDELLHSVIPLLYLGFWWRCKNTSMAPKQSVAGWLIYPLLYLFFILIRGYFSGFYPYPFVNVDQSSFSQVLVNCLVLTLLFFGLSLVLKTIDQKRRA